MARYARRAARVRRPRARTDRPARLNALPGEFDPLALIDALARHEVKYVDRRRVGGEHGAVRRTEHLDICPEWSRENLDRLGAVLSGLDAQLAIAPGETMPVPVIDGVLISRMEIGTWQTQAGGLDVLRGIPKSTTAVADFHELSARAVTAQVSGRPILIADLDDVVRSKRIAGRSKDREALPELEKLRSAADDTSAE